MNHSFMVGQLVKWDASRARAESQIEMYGPGPFTVLGITPVPKTALADAGHPQWLYLNISRDTDHLFSGYWFKPAD